MSGVETLAPLVGVVAACAALGVARATWYRHQVQTCAPPRPSPPRALSAEEKRVVLDTANSERFVDAAPAEIVNTLLEEGVYLCATRTMYRVLAGANEVRERRDQLRHPDYKRPQLLATGPNQVWTWDITKLLCVEKWRYLYVYVIIDVFSRAVVGWLLAEHENAEHAKRLIRETCKAQGVEEEQLTIHSDRGSPMTSKTLAQLLADLVITQSHSRPQVSNDNPFSESQFKTMKYRPDFPDRFVGLRDGIEHCRRFFDWYNNQHKHSGIAYCTPADVHAGRADAVLARRQAALDLAYAAHPERFVKGPPKVARVPAEVWLNPPEESTPTPEPVMQPDLRSQDDLRPQVELHVEHAQHDQAQADLQKREGALAVRRGERAGSDRTPEAQHPAGEASTPRAGDLPPAESRTADSTREPADNLVRTKRRGRADDVAQVTLRIKTAVERNVVRSAAIAPRAEPRTGLGDDAARMSTATPRSPRETATTNTASGGFDNAQARPATKRRRKPAAAATVEREVTH